jgi:hypothetical protein
MRRRESPGRTRLARGKALQLILDVAEGLGEHGQTAEDVEFLGQAHAVVDLDRFLAHVAPGPNQRLEPQGQLRP